MNNWSLDDVLRWLSSNNLDQFKQNFIDNEVDGETILGLSERMVEALIPKMKYRVKFSKLLKDEKTKKINIDQEVIEEVDDINIENQSEDHDNEANEAISSGKDQDPISSRGQDIVSYSLPTFPPHLVVNLTMKAERTNFLCGSRNRRTIIEVISNDLLNRNVLYPSKKTYDLIIDELLQRYHFLGDHNEWKNTLRSKMKSIRRPLCAREDVLYLKQKFGNVKASKKRSLPQMVASLCLDRKKPKLNINEDDGAENLNNEERIQELKQMATESNPNYEKTVSHLNATIKIRYDSIYKEKIQIKAVLENYPILKHPKFLKYEAQQFYSISNPNFENLMNNIFELEKYCKLRLKNFTVLQKQYADDVERTCSTKSTKDASLLYTIKLLPSLFNESFVTFLKDSVENITSPSPQLVKINDKYHLYIDGCPVLNNGVNFKTALDIYFMSFWIFGIKYSENLQTFLLFLEQYFYCSKNKDIKIPKRIKSWAIKLHLE